METPFFKALENTHEGHQVSFVDVIDQLQFDKRGLIPAIAQQHDTGEILMMAWMNRDALLETLNNQRVCYWSRSRQQLWRKGESSGHVQQLVEMRIDCDGDTVLCLVDQLGPACHTQRSNCFYLRVQNGQLTTMTNIEQDS